MLDSEAKHTFKFVLVGSGGVGKTSIVTQLIEGRYIVSHQPTIGVEYRSIDIEIDGSPIKIQIWDTAGQERFRAITKSYFRHAVGVILIFSLTERQSFDEISQWLIDVQSLCDPNAVIFLIGNKCDLQGERQVSNAEASTFAAKNQLTYTETSALDGTNVQNVFLEVARAVYNRLEVINANNRPPQPIKTPEPPIEEREGGCC